MTTDRSRAPRRRRPHAAAGGRLVVGGISLSLLVGLIGAMARSDGPAAASADVATTTSTSSAPPAASGAPVPVPAPVQVTRPTAPPVTTSHAT